MRKPKETKKEVDLTTLLDPSELMGESPDDCFGKEWDPQNGDCAICHDIEICGIVKQSEIKKKVKNMEKKAGSFLDMTAFEKVPMDKIAKTAIEWAEDDDPASYEELVEQIGQIARTKDPVAIREYIKTQLPKYKLMITPEKTVVPYDSSDNNQ